MRTNSRSTSIMFLFITCLYYSNLYSRIKQFVRFLRVNYASTKTSLLRKYIVKNCVRNRLRLYVCAFIDLDNAQIMFEELFTTSQIS